MVTAYFIAYTWTKAGSSGVGNGELIRNKPIYSFKDIQDIEAGICKDKELHACVITNYFELPGTSNEGPIKRLFTRKY